jgi:hypothetical protein
MDEVIEMDKVEFNKDVLEKLVFQLCSTSDIEVKDIPNIGLYMEQMLTFFRDRLDPVMHNEKPLSKMMINNYTKEGLLPQPDKKKYSSYHMMLIILVCQLKHVLSIGDIKKLFNPILNDINNDRDDLLSVLKIYEAFTRLKKEQYDDAITHYTEQLKTIEKETKDIPNEDNKKNAELFLLVLMLTAQANASKQLAERIIDEYF